MTQKEQLRRRIIELIHGVPYEEAVKKDNPSLYCNHCNRKDNFRMAENKTNFYVYCANCENRTEYVTRLRHPTQRDEELAKIGTHKPLTITLGRLLTAIHNRQLYSAIISVSLAGTIFVRFPDDKAYSKYCIRWDTTLPSGQEATLDDQTEETIEALHQLLITE